MTAPEYYAPEDLAVAYDRHVIVEVETLGGIRHIGDVEISLEHDERLFACRGKVADVGHEALLTLIVAHCNSSLGYDGSPLLPAEILFEPKSESRIIPASHSTTGRELVVVSVGDVLAIVRRP